MKDSNAQTDPSPARPIRGEPEPTRRGSGLCFHGGPLLVTVLGGLVILVLVVPSVHAASFAKHEDASGHAHHLTEKGDPTNRDSATAKYEEGYDLDGAGDYLYNDDDTMDHPGAAAWVVVFETDALPSNQILYHVRQDGGGGQYVRIVHRTSGKIRYADTGGDTFTTSGTVPTGEVLGLWLRRTDNGDGTFDLRVKVFDATGTVVLDETQAGLTLPTGLDGSAEMAVGAKADGSSAQDGGVYEVRDWKGTVPSDATLDQVADPSVTGSANFEETAEGTEEGLWFLEPVTVGNAAPTADFTHSCTNLDCDFTDQSTDSDGSIASWSWDFGDGATSTVQHPSHSYACGWTYTVTLTVTDDDGASNSTSQDVPVSDVDTDGDGLTDCVEEAGGTNACGDPWSPTLPHQNDTDTDDLEDGAEVDTHCTDPNDHDTDDDEFSDGQEVHNFASSLSVDPSAVFCGDFCAYPDPLIPNLYLEVDGWADCNGASGADCNHDHTHMMSPGTRDTLRTLYANKGIDLHIDTGQLGGGGELIQGEETMQFSVMEDTYRRNPATFDDQRWSIFH